MIGRDPARTLRARYTVTNARQTVGQYVLCLGLIKGLVMGGLVFIFPWFDGRLMRVPVPGTDSFVQLRHGTSDIPVFNTTFLREDYGYGLAAAPNVIVDAGAYTGLSAVYFATKFPDSQVIAIEPSASNFELLAKNTANIPNVRLVQAALWAESGTLTLTDPGQGAWSYRVDISADSPAAPCQLTEVRAITIEDVMRDFQLRRINLLKLDIEGSEVEVFGSSASWVDLVDVIEIELHDRLKAGCARAFFGAVGDFTIEEWTEETVMVAREISAAG